MKEKHKTKRGKVEKARPGRERSEELVVWLHVFQARYCISRFGLFSVIY
jgi:hypothetical protein